MGIATWQQHCPFSTQFLARQCSAEHSIRGIIGLFLNSRGTECKRAKRVYIQVLRSWSSYSHSHKERLGVENSLGWKSCAESSVYCSPAEMLVATICTHTHTVPRRRRPFSMLAFIRSYEHLASFLAAQRVHTTGHGRSGADEKVMAKSEKEKGKDGRGQAGPTMRRGIESFAARPEVVGCWCYLHKRAWLRRCQ